MNKHEESLKVLKDKLKKENNLSKEEWDIYAKENHLFSSNTIYAHEDVLNWSQLKKKLRKKDKKLDAKIEKVRYKLHQSIEENGLHSEKTKKLNNEINKIINLYYATKDDNYIKSQKDYPRDSEIWQKYQASYIELRNKTIDLNKFPTTQEWNTLAKQKKYLNFQSIEYISGLSWNEIREKILKEI